MSDRKFRLFACGCARRLWEAYFQEWPRRSEFVRPPPGEIPPAIGLAESFADGYTTPDDIKTLHPDHMPVGSWEFLNLQSAAEVVTDAALHENAYFAAFQAESVTAIGFATLKVPSPCSPSGLDFDFHVPSALAREIFGSPSRPVTLDAAWLTPTVTLLAQATYDERILPAGTFQPDRLAILADALEDVGCTDAAILDHLRGLGPHVRGCWVVDLLLGKT